MSNNNPEGKAPKNDDEFSQIPMVNGVLPSAVNKVVVHGETVVKEEDGNKLLSKKRGRSGESEDMANGGTTHKKEAQASEQQPAIKKGKVVSSMNIKDDDKQAVKVRPLTASIVKVNGVANGYKTNKKTSTTKDLRLRANGAAEDYMKFVGDLMYPGTYLGPFGHTPEEGAYPLERPTMLGLLTCPLRKPNPIERWNPYEVALFESAISVFGKLFHEVQKVVQTKTTKEIVEFYYIWKKTSHYKEWKQQFEDDTESDPEDEEDNAKIIAGKIPKG